MSLKSRLRSNRNPNHLSAKVSYNASESRPKAVRKPSLFQLKMILFMNNHFNV